MSGAALVSCTSALVLWSKLQVPDRLMHAILKAAMAAVGGGGGGGAGRPALGAVPEAATAQQQQVARPGSFMGRVDSARAADLLRGRGALAAGSVADAHITAQPAHDQANRKAAAERSQTAARQHAEQGRRATGQGSHVASGMVGLLLSAVYSKRQVPASLLDASTNKSDMAWLILAHKQSGAMHDHGVLCWFHRAGYGVGSFVRKCTMFRS